MDFEKQIKEAIETIRPSLQNDGGDIEFVKIDGKKVYVRLVGACATCMYSAMTLKMGVENMLQQNIDKDIEVINTAFDEQ